MNRTDRLYALVEELRAVAPQPRTARQLADRFEVSVRTIERDIGALLEAGVPLYATPGPGGGHAIDPLHTLPPVNFTSDEAAALAIALARPGRSPRADRRGRPAPGVRPQCRHPVRAAAAVAGGVTNHIRGIPDIGLSPAGRTVTP